MNVVEIYFSDLTAEKQAELLKLAGISSPEEANWDDCHPVTLVLLGEEEEDGAS